MIDFAYIHQSFLKGDIRPFYSDMYAAVILYAIRILGDEYSFMAEDCVQEAVLTTYSRRGEFTTPGEWRAFLMACVRYNAIAVLRKSSNHKRFLESMDAGATQKDSSCAMIEHEIHLMLYSAIDSLPAKYREIFDLSFEQGLKNAEVANLLKIAEITVKKRKATLIEMIRSRLGRHFDEQLILAMLCSEAVSGLDA